MDAPCRLMPGWTADASLWRSFAFYSANMRYLMPDVPVAFHVDNFEETRQFREKNADSILAGHRLRWMPAPLSWRQGLPVPAIIATFHTGPYPLVCGWLMKHRIPFALLISNDVLEKQGQEYRRLYRRVTGMDPDEQSFVCIDASDPGSLFRIRSALNRGMVLVAYLDGNMGTPVPQGTAPQLTIDFLGKPLAVKSGVAFMAHLTGVPVYPLLCYQTGGGVRWLEGTPVVPAKNEPRKVFVTRCITASYRVLESLLRARPQQWEGWLYVHRDLQLDFKSPPELSASLSPETFGDFIPFQVGQRSFVLHAPTFATYRIPEPLREKMMEHANIFFSI